jgi:glycosyltransferase involved in cell wall biosynthesis
VLDQDDERSDVVVVDDGSTDGTAEHLAREFGSQVRVLQQNNRGVSAARNAGIKVCTTDWVALLDSDDQWHADKLRLQAEALAQNPDMRFCHSDEIWMRNGVRVNPMKKHAKRGGDVFAHCLPLCAITPSSAVIHRSVFEHVGYFDETLPACEDYDFWLRCSVHYPVLYVSERLLTRYAGHDDQLSQRYWGMDRFRVRALAKLILSGELNRQQHVLAMRELNAKIKVLKLGAIKRGNRQLLLELAAIRHKLLGQARVFDD